MGKIARNLIYDGSHYDCASNYLLDFAAHGSILIVNRQPLHFCIKNCTPILYVSFLINFLIDIFYYKCCVTCLL